MWEVIAGVVALVGLILGYYLRRNPKTKRQKVFMKFGQVKHDRQNNLLCYLYLQNKTFINAHLVKEGLVSIDTETDFEYRKRFMNMAGIEGTYQR